MRWCVTREAKKEEKRSKKGRKDAGIIRESLDFFLGFFGTLDASVVFAGMHLFYPIFRVLSAYIYLENHYYFLKTLYLKQLELL